MEHQVDPYKPSCVQSPPAHVAVLSFYRVVGKFAETCALKLVGDISVSSKLLLQVGFVGRGRYLFKLQSRFDRLKSVCLRTAAAEGRRE